MPLSLRARSRRQLDEERRTTEAVPVGAVPADEEGGSIDPSCPADGQRVGTEMAIPCTVRGQCAASAEFKRGDEPSLQPALKLRAQDLKTCGMPNAATAIEQCNSQLLLLSGATVCTRNASGSILGPEPTAALEYLVESMLPWYVRVCPPAIRAVARHLVSRETSGDRGRRDGAQSKRATYS